MNLAGIAFWWDMLGEEKHVGDLAKRLPALPVTPLTPSFKNIAARDIIDDGRNILFEQVHFQIPGGKVKIKTQGDLAKEPQFVRCLMKEY